MAAAAAHMDKEVRAQGSLERDLGKVMSMREMLARRSDETSAGQLCTAPLKRPQLCSSAARH